MVAAKLLLRFATPTTATEYNVMDEVENVEGSEPKKKTQTFEHVPGRSAFPVARVQKILKADKGLDGIAKEAVFLVSIVTERFIVRVSKAARSHAGRERRTTVQKKDILMVTRREDEYFFLGDILKEQKETSGKLNFDKQKKQAQDSEEMGEDASSPNASGPTDKKRGKDADADEDEREEGLQFEGGDEARSEGVSLPPSSRPSTPLSLGDLASEPFEPLEGDDDEDQMEEDK